VLERPQVGTVFDLPSDDETGRDSQVQVTADEIRKLLNLELLPHEGGYFASTYRAKADANSAIYYLITPDEFSSLHRLPQEELFHFYLGDAVEMLQLTEAGETKIITIGTDLAAGQRPQVLAPSNVWQGTRLKAGGKFALLGCTVTPAFQYADFEGGKRAELVGRYPQHRDLIERYTR